MNKTTVIEAAYKLICQEQHYCENMAELGLYVTGVTDLAGELVKVAELENDQQEELEAEAEGTVKEPAAAPETLDPGRDESKRKRGKISAEKIKTINQLWADGKKATEIAEAVDCSVNTVYNHVVKQKVEEAKA